MGRPHTTDLVVAVDCPIFYIWLLSHNRTRIRCSRGSPRYQRWRSPIWTLCLRRSSYRRASTRYPRVTPSRSACSSAASTTAAVHSFRPSTIRPAMSKSSAG